MRPLFFWCVDDAFVVFTTHFINARLSCTSLGFGWRFDNVINLLKELITHLIAFFLFKHRIVFNSLLSSETHFISFKLSICFSLLFSNLSITGLEVWDASAPLQLCDNVALPCCVIWWQAPQASTSLWRLALPPQISLVNRPCWFLNWSTVCPLTSIHSGKMAPGRSGSGSSQTSPRGTSWFVFGPGCPVPGLYLWSALKVQPDGDCV